MLLNWRGTVDDMPHVSYYDVYADFERRLHLRAPDEFKNKVVIIGSNAPELSDLRVTSLGSLYPGVYIVATAITNLKDGDWMRRRRLLPVHCSQHCWSSAWRCYSGGGADRSPPASCCWWQPPY